MQKSLAQQELINKRDSLVEKIDSLKRELSEQAGHPESPSAVAELLNATTAELEDVNAKIAKYDLETKIQ
ncbi:MAG: hypothetical protein ACU84Q_10335 [Gammaproteobacteria bacterium]